jgi:hypothetical protein
MSASIPDSFTQWRKSSASGAQGQCVEVAHLPEGQVCVRNSKDRHGHILRFTREEWVAFLLGAKAGEFDHLG